jgi:hemolysin activation/secretion protein
MSIILASVVLLSCIQDKPASQVGAVEQTLNQKPIEPQAKKPDVNFSLPDSNEPAKQQDDQVKVRVERFKFTGYTILSEGTLQSIAAPFEGRELTIREIKDVALLITRKYREEGYLLAWAYIPPQEVKDGVVEVAIVEGRVDKVVVGGNKYYRSDFIMNHMGPLEGQPVLSMDTLERSLLILNDYPNMSAKATLRPGAKVGTTDIYIEVEDSQPIKASFDYDNFGSHDVSEHRLGATVEVYDLWKLGHELSVRGVVGAEVDNLKFGRIEYRMPIGTSGLRLNAMFGYMDYQASGGVLSVIEPNGSGPIYSIGASYPIIKTRTMVLTAEVGFSGRDIEQRIGNVTQSYDHVRLASAGLTLDLSDNFYGRTIVSIQGRQGLGTFLDGTEETDQPSRVGASNDFMKFTASVMRIQKVLNGLYAVVRITGQWAEDPLFTSEQIGLGGEDSVRGYLPFDYAGDRGYTASFEFRLIPPGLGDLPDPFSKGKRKIGDVLQFVFFADWGEAELERPQARERDIASMESVGAGFRITYPAVSIRFDVGVPTAKFRPSTGDDAIYYIQVIASY